MIRISGEDGGSQGIWMHSIECQMIEGGAGDFIVVGDGILLNKATDVKPDKGRIQIQSKAAEVFIRRVELTPISDN